MQEIKPLPDFNHCHINLDHYSIQGEDGKEIFVEPRLLKVLEFLHTHANHVVKRNELVDHVWGEVIVNDESLSKAIFDLRKFLASNFSNVPKITTIRKVGYKLELIKSDNLKPTERITRLAIKVVAYMFIIVFALMIIVRAVHYGD